MSTPPVPARGDQRALLVGLLTGIVAVAFEAVAVATAMPAAARDLGQVGLYAWIFTLFVLGMTFSTVVAGRWADARGPVPPLAMGCLVFVVGLLLAGAAGSMTVLALARFVQGLGGGAMNLALMVVIAQAFDEGLRARVMTWFSVCWVMPAFVGPPISAAITRHWGWHWVFWAVAPLVLVAAVLSARPLVALRAGRVAPEGRGGEARPVSLWAAAGAAASVAGLQAAGQLLDWRGALLALACLGAMAWCVPRLMPAGFTRVAPGLPAVVWTRCCQAGAFFAAESFLPLSWGEQRGLSLFEAGLVLTIGSLGWTLGSWLQARAWLRLRRDQVIVLGLVCSTVGMALVALSSVWVRGTLPLAVLGWTIAGLGMGLAVASTSLATMTLSQAHEIGRNTASLQVAEGLGNSLVAGLAGSIFHALHGDASTRLTFGSVFTLAALVGVLGLLASLRIGPVGVSERTSQQPATS